MTTTIHNRPQAHTNVFTPSADAPPPAKPVVHEKELTAPAGSVGMAPPQPKPADTSPPPSQQSDQAVRELAGFVGTFDPAATSPASLTDQVVSAQQDVKRQVAQLDDNQLDINATTMEIAAQNQKLIEASSPNPQIAAAAFAALLGVPPSGFVLPDLATRQMLIGNLKDSIQGLQTHLNDLNTAQANMKAVLATTTQHLLQLQRKLPADADASLRTHAVELAPTDKRTFLEQVSLMADMANKETQLNVAQSVLAVLQDVRAHLPSPPSLEQQAALALFSAGAAIPGLITADATYEASKKWLDDQIASVSENCTKLSNDIATDHQKLMQSNDDQGFKEMGEIPLARAVINKTVAMAAAAVISHRVVR